MEIASARMLAGRIFANDAKSNLFDFVTVTFSPQVYR